MTRDRTYRPHFMTHRRVENPDDPACTALYSTAAAAAAPPPPPPVKLKYSKLPEGRRASCCDRARTGRVGGHGDFGRPGTRIIHQMMQKSRPIFSKDEICTNATFCLKAPAVNFLPLRQKLLKTLQNEVISPLITMNVSINASNHFN